MGIYKTGSLIAKPRPVRWSCAKDFREYIINPASTGFPTMFSTHLFLPYPVGLYVSVHGGSWLLVIITVPKKLAICEGSLMVASQSSICAEYINHISNLRQL